MTSFNPADILGALRYRATRQSLAIRPAVVDIVAQRGATISFDEPLTIPEDEEAQRAAFVRELETRSES